MTHSIIAERSAARGRRSLEMKKSESALWHRRISPARLRAIDRVSGWTWDRLSVVLDAWTTERMEREQGEVLELGKRIEAWNLIITTCPADFGLIAVSRLYEDVESLRRRVVRRAERLHADA